MQSELPHYETAGSDWSGPIADESEVSTGVKITPGKRYGFFTDTTLCIGCKACEVACQEWNQLPSEDAHLTGLSYDNTGDLSSTTWRHVSFIEKLMDENKTPAGTAEATPGSDRASQMPPFQSHWLMNSDVCKHCSPAPCLESCPTGSLFRTEFDTVVVQQDVCNGCGYCVPACPFGVVDVNHQTGTAQKCTMCYDRLRGGLEPACSKTCPTNSIQFGEWDELRQRAARRLDQLQSMGRHDAYLYGVPDGPGTGSGIDNLNAFFLLSDRPETYNFPAKPMLPSRRIGPTMKAGLFAVAGLAFVAAAIFARPTD